MTKLKVIISGGGTGGHLFPALSIANEIKARVPEVDILFVGALGRMEMERVPIAGYPIYGLPVIGMPRKFSPKMFKFLWLLNKSMFEARKIIRNFKPDIAIGVGGYASGPLLKAANQKGIPTIIQEQNSYAGVTNKLLASKARKICVAYQGMEKYFPKDKLVVTGNPIRQNLLEKVDKKEALKLLGLKEDMPVVLMLGGSLGAKTLNDSILNNMDFVDKSGVQVIWQSGKVYHNDILERLDGKLRENIQLHQFLAHMDKAFAAADLVISRAGAATISEICLLGKPTILVPSPNVAEDHQTKNAMALVDNNAAVMVKDSDAVKDLFPTAFELIKDKEKLAMLSENSLKMARPKATADIVNVILNEVKNL